MPKKKLNLNQQRRINHNQTKIEINADYKTGLIGLVVSHYGDQIDIEDNLGKKFKCNLRQNLPALAVGDRVLYQIEDLDKSIGVVNKLLPRRSLLTRMNSAAQTNKPIAANLDQMLIIFSFEPEPQSLLIDQFLITAHACDIQPILVFNKLDLFEKLDRNNKDEKTKIEQINNLLSIYENIGYPILKTSLHHAASIKKLEDLLADKNSLFIGASGVGKSTLTQQLVPDIKIKTGEINEKTLLGRHTTSVSKLYHLVNNGNLIDAPGIRELEVEHISQSDIESAYPEFAPFVKKCKFRDCIHEKEPNCAFKQAVHEGLINQVRWTNYLRLRAI